MPYSKIIALGAMAHPSYVAMLLMLQPKPWETPTGSGGGGAITRTASTGPA